MTQIIDLGRIRWHYTGAYDAGTDYEMNDIVKFGGNLYVYVYSVREAGIDPSDAEHWELLIPSLQAAGAWAANTDYALNEVVTHGAGSHVCTTAHTSGAAFDASKWQVLAEGMRWRDDFAADTVYLRGDVVKSGMHTYIAQQDFTAGASVAADGAKWKLLLQGIEDPLPARAGHSGKQLTNDGTNAVWRSWTTRSLFVASQS